MVITQEEMTVTGEEIQKEVVKISKNTRGYNWEIKVISEGKQLNSKDLERLRNIDMQMRNEYGGIAE